MMTDTSRRNLLAVATAGSAAAITAGAAQAQPQPARGGSTNTVRSA